MYFIMGIPWNFFFLPSNIINELIFDQKKGGFQGVLCYHHILLIEKLRSGLVFESYPALYFLHWVYWEVIYWLFEPLIGLLIIEGKRGLCQHISTIVFFLLTLFLRSHYLGISEVTGYFLSTDN